MNKYMITLLGTVALGLGYLVPTTPAQALEWCAVQDCNYNNAGSTSTDTTDSFLDSTTTESLTMTAGTVSSEAPPVATTTFTPGGDITMMNQSSGSGTFHGFGVSSGGFVDNGEIGVSNYEALRIDVSTLGDQYDNWGMTFSALENDDWGQVWGSNDGQLGNLLFDFSGPGDQVANLGDISAYDYLYVVSYTGTCEGQCESNFVIKSITATNVDEPSMLIGLSLGLLGLGAAAYRRRQQ